MVLRNDMTRLVDRSRALTSHFKEVLAAVEHELSDAPFVAVSDGGLVEVEADYLARVVRIDVDRRGLTRTRGTDLARQVVQAVTQARADAMAEYQRRLRARAHPRRPAI